MGFPVEDEYWTEIRDFLQKFAQNLSSILAPNEFIEFFPGTYPYNITYVLRPEQFEFVVFHKGMLADVEPPFALEVLQQFTPVFANPVFVVYAKHSLIDLPLFAQEHLAVLWRYQETWEDQLRSRHRSPTFASVITTYNRPQSLARSLPQILALGAPVVILDDGSSTEHHRENQRLADQHQVPLIFMPTNRGLCNAINNGIGYWLADPDIDWISYFQDDIDINPQLFDQLAQVQDAEKRPLLTGYHATEHPTYATETCAGITLLHKRTSAGLHLHGHRTYWAAVLPIPTPYLGAPKPDRGKPGQGADEDWWITAWSPHAITKRGGMVVCVPGLVTTFQTSASGSTWGNPGKPQLPQGESPAGQEPARVFPSPSNPSLAMTPNLQEPPSTLPSDRPTSLAGALKGVNVVLDGVNLQLLKGTGIKTYTISLSRALKLLGADVDVLFSRKVYKRNRLLDEVTFFDEPGGRGGKLLEALSLAKTMTRSLLGNYQAWKRESVDGVVVTRGKFVDDFLQYTNSYNLPWCYENANRAFTLLKWTTTVTVPGKVDLWHATYPLPVQIKGARKVTTIHDIIPLRLPYATLDNKNDFYYRIKNTLKKSAVTITVSEHTRQDVLKYFDVDPDKLVVTYQPVTLKPLDVDDQTVTEYLKRYRLKYQQYFLFVGAIEPKKNLARLLEAYAALKTSMPLVLVGKKAWAWADELGRMGYLLDQDSRYPVKLLEYVSLESLRYLYRGANCLVFPSLYEGFGLPPVEAMTMGCPVITSTTSCLPEVCGSGALYVDPYNIKDIQEKMEKMSGDRSLREHYIEQGKHIAERFSMDNYLQRLYAAYQQALS